MMFEELLKITPAVFYWSDTPCQVESNKTMSSFDQILEEMSDLYHKKNSDYGNSFTQTLDTFGETAGYTRLMDKMNRLIALSKQDAHVKDESKQDTLIDLANYAVMLLDWMRKQ